MTAPVAASLIDRAPVFRPLRDQERDLFGEVIVTERDLRLWLWSVPVWFNRHSRQASADAYLRGYRVAEKVAHFKAESRLADVFGDECCRHCGQPLESGMQARLDELEAENAELRALLNRPRAPAVPLRLAARNEEAGHPSRLPLAYCHG